MFNWAAEMLWISLLLSWFGVRGQPFVIDSLLLGLQFPEAVSLLVTYRLFLTLLILESRRQSLGIELNIGAVLALWEGLEPIGTWCGFLPEV